MFRRHKPGGGRQGREGGRPGGDEAGGDEAGGDEAGGPGENPPRDRRPARRIIPMARRGGREKPEPEFRGTDIFAMVIAGLQVILPYFFIILAAIVVTYLLVAAFFGM